jgi:hypothetical protein
MTEASFNAAMYTSQDPNVLPSQLRYVSPTTITFVVSVAAGAPIEQDGFALYCTSGHYVQYPMFITPCAIPVTPTIASIQPDTWVAGANTPVTVTGTGFMPVGNANGCAPINFNIAELPGPVNWSNIVVNSPTQMTLTVTPTAGDAAESASVTVSNANPNGSGTTAWVPSNALTANICPGATLKSFTPTVWTAGQQTAITVTGTGFITSAAATAACPATQVTATAPDGSTVTFSSVNVASTTSITAMVEPASAAPTEGATLTVSNAPTPKANADILGTPIISLNGSPITGPNAQAPALVTGQQLAFITSPTAATLAALPIKLTLAKTTPTAWTVTGGTNIGGYTPTTTLYTTGSVTAMPPLDTPTLTFYSVYPATDVAVTYKYCVSGQTTCPEATATLDVSGPTGGTITTEHVGTVGIQQLNGQPNLQFGTTLAANAGVLFAPSATAPSGYSNNFVWAQLISKDLLTANGSTCTFLADAGPDLDTEYPAPPVEGTNNFGDAPPISLLATDTSVTRVLNAETYLLWSSGLTNAIPVPIGSIAWGFSGTATNTGTLASPVWGATGTGSAGRFAASQDVPPNYGYPTWGKITTITKCYQVN